MLSDGTIVIAKNQTQGRGQMGAKWQSKTGQSLTFSMFKRFENLNVVEQSKITFGVSVGIRNVLNKLQIPAITIKWPNDIMSYQQKLCGVLIENQLEGSRVSSAIIGIGINVNETDFLNLPQATSMKLVSGNTFILEEVLHLVFEEILQQLKSLDQGNISKLKETYEDLLFRKNKVSVFENLEKVQFNGMIKGVTNTGELIIETEDENLRTYELKEIKMFF